MEQSKDEVWGIAESHLNIKNLAKLEKKGLKGRSIVGSPATELHNASTAIGMDRSNHGGVLMIPDRNLGGRMLAGARGSQGRSPQCGIGAIGYLWNSPGCPMWA